MTNFLDSVDWPRLMTKLGWPNFRFHDLRGTAISQWIAAGIPLTTVRELAGHASLSTTNLYARSADSALAEAKKLADSHIARNLTATKRMTQPTHPQEAQTSNRTPEDADPEPQRTRQTRNRGVR
ncbi:protein of unknown function [Micropruina glycogenica]|uniref:Tyr recombinase domain-containing protein n=2 Tax=Micropruina glycogenica TaxID=75385 RepID=A0A2N9JJC1_9ACTN|nr:protein of unknown function [Micropruina glycogenica]